jgi:hypothetical protein
MSRIFAEIYVSAFNDIVRNDPRAEAYLREVAVFTGSTVIVKLVAGERGAESQSDQTRDQLYATSRNLSPERASRLVRDLNELDIHVIDSFHNPEFPFHFFVLAEKRGTSNKLAR